MERAPLTDEQRAKLLQIRKARLRQLIASRGPFTAERKRAMRELLGNRRRPNPEIARAAGVCEKTVRRARRDLEQARVIGAWRPPPGLVPALRPVKPLKPPRPPRSPRPSSKRDRARAALLAGPEWSNAGIAREIGTTPELVRRVRHDLEAAGAIGIWRPPGFVPHGASGHRRDSPGRARITAALLAGARRSNAKIAAEAGVSGKWVRVIRRRLEDAGEIGVYR